MISLGQVGELVEDNQEGSLVQGYVLCTEEPRLEKCLSKVFDKWKVVVMLLFY